jgi:hypothetical protein
MNILETLVCSPPVRKQEITDNKVCNISTKLLTSGKVGAEMNTRKKSG